MIPAGETDGRTCLIDGSAFAPSWRRVSELEELYQSPENEGGEVSELIGAMLDELELEWSGAHGESLGWEDGCLFIFGPEYRGEEL